MRWSRKTGATGLEMNLRRKSWGPNYVRFGLNLEDDFEGNSRYNAAHALHHDGVQLSSAPNG